MVNPELEIPELPEETNYYIVGIYHWLLAVEPEERLSSDELLHQLNLITNVPENLAHHYTFEDVSGFISTQDNATLRQIWKTGVQALGSLQIDTWVIEFKTDLSNFTFLNFESNTIYEGEVGDYENMVIDEEFWMKEPIEVGSDMYAQMMSNWECEIKHPECLRLLNTQIDAPLIRSISYGKCCSNCLESRLAKGVPLGIGISRSDTNFRFGLWGNFINY